MAEGDCTGLNDFGFPMASQPIAGEKTASELDFWPFSVIKKFLGR
jgi:hypothetical protein